MQELTSNRYEVLYPRTNVDQVDGYIKPWKVGDVRITSRTDLSDNWLLCNGSVVSQSDYPLLNNAGKTLTKSSPKTYWLANENLPRYIAPFEKYNIAIGYNMDNSFYKSEDGIHWTLITNTLNLWYPNDYFDDGQYLYLIGGNTSSDGAYRKYLKFTTNGSFVAQGVMTKDYSSTYVEHGYKYWYQDGKYCYITPKDYYEASSWENMVSHTWTKTTSTKTDYSYISGSFFYNNDFYYLATIGYNTTTSNIIKISRGNYQVVKVLDNSAIGSYSELRTNTACFDYENSVLYSLSNPSNGVSKVQAYSLKDGSLKNFSWSDGYRMRLIAGNGYFVVACSQGGSSTYSKSYAAKYSDTTVTQTPKSTDYNLKYYKGLYLGNKWYSLLGIALPTYTPADNLSAYIKAKEGE